MLARITSLIRKRKVETAADRTAAMSRLTPAQSFCAIGDIHGCYTQLRDVLHQLDSATDPSETRVFLGDYIDRGPQSKQVLALLFQLSQSAPDRVICLKGNHEQMMLDFIDDPAGNGQHWLRHGGVAALTSYGIAVPHKELDSATAVDVANALEAALPAGMLTWLRQLPLHWASGNLHCVHAALSPRRAPEDQRKAVLLWGHPDFLTKPRDDGNFVVHGHTIVKQPGVRASRIALDTGAYRTGRLTAARLSTGNCRFFEAKA